ncbi:MAG: ADP compounds hydrolase NudE [Gammaproteobacteria bacterium]|nr:ADP compounds hydrolase NudE [Gammaproteobacteria bacterium]
MAKPPRLLQSKIVAKSRLFTIEQMDLRFSNGVEVQYERLLGSANGAVLIIPMRDDDTVLLIREYAAGVQRYELALPKGRIEDGESALQAANREMMEEVGYGARKLTLLRSLTTSPSYLNHATHIVLAQQLYPKKLEGDEPEEIEVVPWCLSELDTLLLQDECSEARSIAALFMARELLQKAPS